MNDLYRETKYDIKNYKKSKKFNLNLVTNLYSNNIKVNGIYTNTKTGVKYKVDGGTAVTASRSGVV